MKDKKMSIKQIPYLLLTLSLLFVSSCNDKDENNSNSNDILVGSWGEQFEYEFFELIFYSDNTGIMNVYCNGGKNPDPFSYSFDKGKMRLTIIFDSDPEPPIVYDVKISEGRLELDCVSGDFEDFSMYRIQ